MTGCNKDDSVIIEYENTIIELNKALEEQEIQSQKLHEDKIKLKKFSEEQSQRIDELENIVANLEEVTREANNQVAQIPQIRNWKYQETSGLKRYVGDTGIRAYPSLDAPIIVNKSNLIDENAILFCRAVVIAGQALHGQYGSEWGIVLMNDYGQMKAGYVPYNELEAIDYPTIEYVESIGGFHLGDRIEKMIGTLDRDYKLISENLCMYTFPDQPYESGAPHTHNNEGTIQAFVSNDFRIFLLRTNSANYVLASGYKVGDNAIEVIDYYSSLYEESNLDAMTSWGEYEYKLSETEYIAFRIDTNELNEESIIKSIIIH